MVQSDRTKVPPFEQQTVSEKEKEREREREEKKGRWQVE
jgi:hypothetical protein